MNLTTIGDRWRLGQFLNQNGLRGAMVEVGCAEGYFSKSVLRNWDGWKYFMVDPWIDQPKSVYKECTDGINFEEWFAKCQEIAKADKRVEILRMFSHDASLKIPDGTMDCVYIDGNHSREAVQQDILDWWPKLKSGGVFGGHDFYDWTIPEAKGAWCEVFTTVKQFMFKMGLPLVITDCSSFWVQKP